VPFTACVRAKPDPEFRLRNSWQTSSKNVIPQKLIITAFASTLSLQYIRRRLLDSSPSPNAMWENVFLLILTAAIKVFLTAWTFGMMVRY
jgi:hypothetical protein